jgi:two-component system sensor histidine kinase RpfC
MEVEDVVLQEARRDVEREQALMRLLLVVSGVLYTVFLAATNRLDSGFYHPVIRLGASYTIFSIIIIIQTYLYPNGARLRHTIYMLFDVALVCALLIYLGEYGVPFFAVYLWLTVGNGFRYGYKELILCAISSLIGFLIVVSTTEFWSQELLFTIMGVILLSIIPLYVSVMLKRLQAEKYNAEQANKEKTRFLANVSHEIRTPLNAVVGFSEILDREVNRVRRAQITRNIRDASASLMTLVEGVLDFSRIESGHVRIEKEAYNLYGLVQSIEGMFSMQAGEGGVRYITDMDISLPPCVCGDIDRIRQILVNLVGNAVKFTSAGEIKVRVSKIRSEGNSERILFEVIDTGIGMSESVQSRIFERFLQADDSVQRRYGGTGLGTSIAKSLVDLMGGEIGIESEENKGSRFWFHIPLIEVLDDQRVTSDTQPNCCVVSTQASQDTLVAALPGLRVFENWNELDSSNVVPEECCVIVDYQAIAQDEVHDIARSGRIAGTCLVAFHENGHKHDDYLRAGFHLVVHSHEYIENVLSYAARILDTRTKNNLKEDLSQYLKSGKRLRILVTDDCRLNRHVMKAMLDEMNVDSDFAASGPVALEKLRSSEYDLLVLDIQMPGMSGFDVIELYKARNSEHLKIPIIVITGDATADIYDKCDQLGVSRFLLKPVDQEKLSYALTSLITLGGYESSASSV